MSPKEKKWNPLRKEERKTTVNSQQLLSVAQGGVASWERLRHRKKLAACIEQSTEFYEIYGLFFGIYDEEQLKGGSLWKISRAYKKFKEHIWFSLNL